MHVRARAGHGDHRLSCSGHVGAARKVEQRVVRIKVGDTAGACNVALRRNNIAVAAHARYARIVYLGLAKAAQVRTPALGDVGARTATVTPRNGRAHRCTRAPIAYRVLDGHGSETRGQVQCFTSCPWAQHRDQARHAQTCLSRGHRRAWREHCALP